MTFCPKCGKPLQEGEMCDCEIAQAAPIQTNAKVQPSFQAPNMDMIKGGATGVLSRVTQFISRPVDTLVDVANEDDMNNVVVSYIATAVLTLIALIFTCIRAKHEIVKSISEYLGKDYAKAAAKEALPFGRVFLIIVVGTIFAVAIYAVISFGLYFFSTKGFGDSVTIAQAFSLVGTKAIVDSLLLIVGMILGIIIPILGTIIIGVGGIITAVAMVYAFSKISFIDENKKVWVVALTVVCVAIVTYIVIRLGGQSLINALGGSL